MATHESSEHEKKRRTIWEGENQEIRMHRWNRLRGVDIQQQLERLMGAGSQFRGVQRVTIEAIMAGEIPVIAVMPTGGGKSMTFMLPASCGHGGVSVVVLLLIALWQDMRRRCETMGITCEEWSSRQPPEAASLLLVTPESAVTGDFQTFIN